MLSVRGYCRSPETKKLVMWETDVKEIGQKEEVEMLLSQLENEGKKIFAKFQFKGPFLLLIQKAKEVVPDLPLLKA